MQRIHIPHLSHTFNVIIYNDLTIVSEILNVCPEKCNCNNNCTCKKNYMIKYNHTWLDAMYKFSKNMQKFDPGVNVIWERIEKNVNEINISDYIDNHINIITEFIYKRITRYLPKNRLHIDNKPVKFPSFVRVLSGYIHNHKKKRTDFILEEFYQIYNNCYCLLECKCYRDYIGENKHSWDMINELLYTAPEITIDDFMSRVTWHNDDPDIKCFTDEIYNILEKNTIRTEC